MLAAMEDVKSGNSSLSPAAKVHNVPRSTLHDHISGRVLHGYKPGPKPSLVAPDHYTPGAIRSGDKQYIHLCTLQL